MADKKPDTSIMKAIQAINSDDSFPVMKTVKDNPLLAAVISKLINDRYQPYYGTRGERETIPPNTQMFKELSNHTAQNITDAETVMQMLPDMELSKQILVSSIISPKDMVTTELIFTVTEGFMAADVSAALISCVSSYFDKDYKIKPLLPKILEHALFNTGSFPIAVIPENAIDDIINSHQRVTMESLTDTIQPDGTPRSIGLLGPNGTPPTNTQSKGFGIESLQSFTFNKSISGNISELKNTDWDHISVTDNFQIIKMPLLQQRLREDKVTDAIGMRAMKQMQQHALEAKRDRFISDRAMTGLIYKQTNATYKPIATLKTQEQLQRRTIGTPLVMHIPSEAVIPVHIPGSPENQVGFFVLLDGDGNPLSKANSIDHFKQLGARLSSTGSFPSAMLGRVKSMVDGFDNLRTDEKITYTARAYADLIEKDLLERLRNGVYGNGVAIARREEIYRIMLARALAKQHSHLVFIPVELMTYFAFDYSSDGIGRSILDNMKVLNSLRSMVMFGNVMASLRNSIGRTQVNLKFDPDDPNPQKTMETLIHEIIRSRQHYFPIGLNSPTDIVDYLQKAGYEFTYEGHPGMPDVKVDFSEKSTNYVKPDSELEDSLRKRSIMATGLSPEMVDNSFQPDFATSVVSNNLLLSKRVLHYQEQFMPQLSEHLRKYMLNSDKLINELRDILESNYDKLEKGTDEQSAERKEIQEHVKEYGVNPNQNVVVDYYLHEFIMNLNVSLPKPNSVTLENQVAALQTYVTALDQGLEAYISDKFFTSDTGGNIASQVGVVKEVIKAHFIRQWMNENGMMPELSTLTTTTGSGTATLNLWETQQQHLESLMESLSGLMKGLQPKKDETNKEVEELSGLSSGSSSSSSDSGSSSSDEFGGDFNFDSGEETPPEEATTTETETPEPESEEPTEEKKTEEEKPTQGGASPSI